VSIRDLRRLYGFSLIKSLGTFSPPLVISKRLGIPGSSCGTGSLLEALIARREWSLLCIKFSPSLSRIGKELAVGIVMEGV
jgi:hypothetical protein